MLLHACANELSSCGQDEIAFHTLPHEMKFVVVKPHIGSGTLDGVCARFSIVGSRAGLIYFADVIVALKDTEGVRLGKRYRRYKKINYGEYHYKAGESVFHRDLFSRSWRSCAFRRTGH